MTDRDELEAIVREISEQDPLGTTDTEMPSRTRPFCVYCGEPEIDGTVQHVSDCPWRRAREWVARQGGERG